MSLKSRPTSDAFPASAGATGSVRRPNDAAGLPTDTFSAKQRASKRAMKTFSYANASLANTPTLLLESQNETFSTKSLDLFETIKIGRKVTPKSGPEATNGIFDSKVLSRNHAEIWYADGKVWIKDVKSSNGTFVNGKRLSDEGNESEPVELPSGARLEFGIDINHEDGSVMYKKVSCKVTVVPSPILGAPDAVKTEKETSKIPTPARRKSGAGEHENMSAVLEKELRHANEVHAELQQLKSKLDALESSKVPDGTTHTPAAPVTPATTSSPADTAAAVSAATSDLLRQLEDAQTEVKKWMGKYNDTQKRLEDQDALQNKALNLTAEVERLTKESTALQSLHGDAEKWKARATKAEAEVSTLKERLAKQSADSESADQSARQTKSQISTVEEKLAKATKEKQAATTKTEKLDRELTSLKSGLETTRSEFESQQAALRKVEQDAEKLRKTNEELKQKLDVSLAANAAATAAAAAAAGKSSDQSPSRGDSLSDSSGVKRTGSMRRRKQKGPLPVQDEETDEVPTPNKKKAVNKKSRPAYQIIALIAISFMGGFAYWSGLFAPNSPLFLALRGASR
ncbi:hypothetical protein DFS34DRAFT_635955 [Phlyctochytrium arcticum]|nr:hypothetical protein DFS34DRAFT_635955 [Phlyctochytrium arcticum]